jgi:predicted nucleotidyltransferase
MMNTSKDISEKIDQSLIVVIESVNAIMSDLGIPFFIIGASARDIVFSAMFDIPTRRATRDVDFAIRVPSWDKVHVLVSKMLSANSFRQDSRMRQRFIFQGQTVLDIVPFGGLERPPGSVQWPLDAGFIMSTAGFEDAFDHSAIVLLKKNPELKIKVCAPPGLAILKLMAWHEKYPERSKDAKDILFLMEHYIDAGNESRLHDQDRDLMDIHDFDYGLASPRLLGRDMAKIASVATRVHVMNVLRKESDTVSENRLAFDMMQGEFDVEGKYARTMALLRQLCIGFQDRRQE